MRIAISGTGGIGKTTLAKALADTLGVPLLAENLQDIVMAIGKWRQSQLNCDTTQLNAARQAYMRACETWLNDRVRQQARNPGFVADRWALDILVRWLQAGIEQHNDALTSQLVTHVQGQARSLDLVVFPPLRRLDMAPSNNDGLTRHQHLSARLHSHALSRGLLEQLTAVARLDIPDHVIDINERVGMVIGKLQPRQPSM